MEDYNDILSDMESDAQKTISVDDFDAFIEDYEKQRDLLKQYDDKKKEQEKHIAKLNGQLIEYLDALGRKSYEGRNGKINVITQWSVRLPQGDDKKKFFEYLKAKGDEFFESIVHINSRTLQSFVREEMKAHEEMAGFSVPGCSNSESKRVVRFTRSK